MERLVIRLLGEPSVQFDGEPWAFKAPQRSFAILALLSINRRDPVKRASVASAIWPELSDPEARANLRRHLHLVRQSLPVVEGVEWIESHGLKIAWNDRAPAWIDLTAFDEGIADPKRRAQAIDLYRGTLLCGGCNDILLEQRERLELLCVAACREEALAARGRLDFATAIHYADRILAMDEWREDALRLGMTLRYESGDRSSALASFERFAEHLREEMGVDPMPETLALRDAVLMNAAVPDTNDASRENNHKRENERRRETLGTPFVGRSREMEVLETAWQETARGRGCTQFVAGEAGIGKSRLVSEFASLVSHRGGRVLAGETSNPERYPYEPFVDILRRGLALILESPVGQPWLSIVAELLPELRAAVPDLPDAEPLDPAKARNRLFEAIARTIERLAKVRPLLLVLEDVHWSQAATLDVIEALTRRIGGVPGMLVITYRTGENSPAGGLLSLRRRLQSEGRAASMELRPLGAGDVGELVRTLPNLADADKLSASIYAASEGNPLFAAQLLRGYAETGHLPNLATTAATVTQAILARAATLDARTVALAEVASAIGGSFTIDVLAGALGWNEGDVVDALGTLIDRSLVRAVAAPAFSYAFVHALIAGAIYDLMPEKVRVLRHRRIAAVLSANEDVESSALASIARHWERGGEPQRAGFAYAAAAKAAFSRYAPDEGIAFARSSLGLCSDAQTRFDMLLLIARAERKLMDLGRWKADLDALALAVGPLGIVQQVAAFREWAEYYGHTGENTAERAVVEQTLALTRSLAPTEHGGALFTLGQLELHRGRREEAIRPFEEALDIALLTGDRAAEARSRGRLIHITSILGRPQDAIAHREALRGLTEIDSSPELLALYLSAQAEFAFSAQDAHLATSVGNAVLDLYDRVGDRMQELNGVSLLIFGSQWLSSASVTRGYFERATKLCEELGYERGVTITKSNWSYLELQLGLPRRSLAMTEQLLQELERLGEQSLTSLVYKNRSAAFLLLGDGPAALEAGRISVDLASTLDPRPRSETSMALGCALCASGDSERGLQFVAEAVDLTRNLERAPRLMEYLSQYVSLLLEADRIDQVPAVAAELRELDARHAGKISIWHPSRVMYALARAAHLAGNAREAGEYAGRGRAILAREIERLGEEVRETLEAFSFNRALLRDSRTLFGRFP